MSQGSNDFQTLMQQLRAGSQEAANELATKYASHVRRAVRDRMRGELRPKYDSVDFEQQVWKSFFAEAKSLPDLQDPAQLIGYLVGIARHKVADEGRHLLTQKHDVQREVRIDERAATEGSHPASRDPTPSAVAVFHEEFELLVSNQPPQVRRLVELKMQGMTNHEIADALGVHERTVRRMMERLEEQNGWRVEPARDN
jgi:RNA polymerase sigma factor (sigma-70 family)